MLASGGVPLAEMDTFRVEMWRTCPLVTFFLFGEWTYWNVRPWTYWRWQGETCYYCFIIRFDRNDIASLEFRFPSRTRMHQRSKIQIKMLMLGIHCIYSRMVGVCIKYDCGF